MSAMKAMRMKKAKKVSKVGKMYSVFSGKKVRTSGGLKKEDLKKSKSGKIVSKKKSELGKKIWAKSGLKKWAEAVSKARKQQKVVGFVAIGGKTAKGQALLKAVRSF